MIRWLFLAGAILSEVSATLALRASVDGSRWWYVAVGVGYIASFVLLWFALSRGMGLAVAYGTWSAIGVALTAAAGWLLFGERLTPTMIAGLVLVMVGVWLLETGAVETV